MAITNIIRAFKPMNKASQTAGAGMQQFADETEEATDAAIGGGNLDFDEFRAMSSEEDSQLSITQAITEELQRQIDAYNAQVEAMNQVQNAAIEISERIKDWFIVTDDEGMFVEWTNQAKGLFAVLAALPILSVVSKIKTLTAANQTLHGITLLLPKVFTKQGLIFTAIGAALLYAYNTNEEFRESINKLLETGLKVIGTLLKPLEEILPVITTLLDLVIGILTPILQVVTAILSFNDGIVVIIALIGLLAYKILYELVAKAIMNGLNKSFMLMSGTTIPTFSQKLKALWGQLDTTKAKFIGVAAGVGLLVYQVSNLVMNWDNMSNAERIVGILGAIAAAAFVAAAAITGMQSAWTLGIGVAAIGLGLASAIMSMKSSMSDAESYASSLQSSISGFADGGITDANFIMTHENGVREWVGRQGNSTAVVNDTQMSDVMGRAVRNGVLEAMSYGTGQETLNITVQANLDGQKVYESTKRIARKNGEKFARV